MAKKGTRQGSPRRADASLNLMDMFPDRGRRQARGSSRLFGRMANVTAASAARPDTKRGPEREADALLVQGLQILFLRPHGHAYRAHECPAAQVGHRDLSVSDQLESRFRP